MKNLAEKEIFFQGVIFALADDFLKDPIGKQLNWLSEQMIKVWGFDHSDQSEKRRIIIYSGVKWLLVWDARYQRRKNSHFRCVTHRQYSKQLTLLKTTRVILGKTLLLPRL